jgi:hypothetical protein
VRSIRSIERVTKKTIMRVRRYAFGEPDARRDSIHDEDGSDYDRRENKETDETSDVYVTMRGRIRRGSVTRKRT